MNGAAHEDALPAVDYTLTEDDWVAFLSDRAHREARYGRWLHIWEFVFGLGFIVIAVAVGLVFGESDWWYDGAVHFRVALVIGALVFLAFCFQEPIVRWRVRRDVQAGRGAFIGLRWRIVLSDKGMDFGGDHAHFLRWSGVGDIVVSEAGIYVVLEDQTYFPVPRRAFPDNDQLMRFARAAHGFWRQSVKSVADMDPK